MAKMNKYSLVLLLTTAVLLVLATALINITMIPRGLHLMNHINRLEYNKSGFENSWLKYVTFTSLSEFIFKSTGNYCDAPYFENRILVDGKDMTISFLISGHSENVSADTKKIIYKELKVALTKCNPNIIGELQPFPPIHMAVLYGDANVVSLLINNNARTDVKIARPGKKIDNMTPLEFANFLEAREKDKNKKKLYREVVDILEKHVSPL